MISKSERADLKSAAADYYDRNDPTIPGNICCMILNISMARDKVTSSHIWKSETHGDGLQAFGLSPESVHSVRNILLLATNIERAFDVKQLCFLYNPLQQTLTLKILDPILFAQKIRDDPVDKRTFRDIDSSVLRHPHDKFPYRRILHWHAKMSFAHAKIKGWINYDENFESYFDVSSDASHRDENELEEYF